MHSRRTRRILESVANILLHLRFMFSVGAVFYSSIPMF
nr:MAG TPA: hypothetical protein [Caudoviricetes sp.]